MSELALPREAIPRKSFTTWQLWGLLLLAPYVLVFLVFVLYPITYGLWLARNPDSYRTLFEDPVFFTKPFTIVRTFKRGAPTDRILPYSCEENNIDKNHLVPNQPNKK